MILPGYEVESVPIERSMPAAPKSSRGVDDPARTGAVVVQEHRCLEGVIAQENPDLPTGALDFSF